MEHSIYRGSGNCKKDPQAPGLVGSEGKATATGQRVATRRPYRLLSPPWCDDLVCSNMNYA